VVLILLYESELLLAIVLSFTFFAGYFLNMIFVLKHRSGGAFFVGEKWDC
jgi:hypothetical protein